MVGFLHVITSRQTGKVGGLGFLKLVSVFKEASQDFIFHFLHNKAAKKLKNHRRIHRKYRFEF
jgi:hypothetical protein